MGDKYIGGWYVGAHLLLFCIYDVVYYIHFIHQLRTYIWGVESKLCSTEQPKRPLQKVVKGMPELLKYWEIKILNSPTLISLKTYKEGWKAVTFQAGLFCRNNSAHWVTMTPVHLCISMALSIQQKAKEIKSLTISSYCPKMTNSK